MKRRENRSERTPVILVSLDDVRRFQREGNGGGDLLEGIVKQPVYYSAVFSAELDSKDFMGTDEVLGDADVKTAWDTTLRELATGDGSASVPLLLRRRFITRFACSEVVPSVPMRRLLSEATYMGMLTRVRGIVTRCGTVEALVSVAAFVCEREECSKVHYQVVLGDEYKPTAVCDAPQCLGKLVKLRMEPRASRFLGVQDASLQELSAEVPRGGLPRALHLRLVGDALSKKAYPGDEVELCGVLLPVHERGFRRRGLHCRSIFQVYDIVDGQVSTEARGSGDSSGRALASSGEADADGEEGGGGGGGGGNGADGEGRFGAELDKVIALLQRSNRPVYDELADAIVPEIFGHLDVRKALLLMLVGGLGVQGQRGDINIMLCGDPGVAKSQMLRSVSALSPRGVFTTGRGSSSVGLTAAVIRDEQTGESVLEGGSLVLADRGICCIDEFDKMDEQDRSSIHEVMEQQTVSIAKAGITTTLNARTSVLAAANPVEGVYMPRMSLEENVNLPAALLSRFDLVFILRDHSDEESDRNLTKHICGMITGGDAYLKARGRARIPREFIRLYLAAARTVKPHLPKGVQKELVEHFVSRRQKLVRSANSTQLRDRAGSIASSVTPRTLVAVVRLALAHARLHLREEVTSQDVQESIRLAIIAQQSAGDADGQRDGAPGVVDDGGAAMDGAGEAADEADARQLVSDAILAKGDPLADADEDTFIVKVADVVRGTGLGAGEVQEHLAAMIEEGEWMQSTDVRGQPVDDEGGIEYVTYQG